MAIAFVNTTIAVTDVTYPHIADTANSDGPIDISGANLLDVWVLWADHIFFTATDYYANFVSITDSESNTFTLIDEWSVTDDSSSPTLIIDFTIRHYKVANPTTDAAWTMAFEVTDGLDAIFGNAGIVLWAQAFSGTNPAGDQASDYTDTTAGLTDIQSGSITPSANDSLVITYCRSFDDTAGTYGGDLAAASTPNPTETMTETTVWEDRTGLAYLLQGTAAAINPTWNMDTDAYKAFSKTYSYTPEGAAGGTGNFFQFLS